MQAEDITTKVEQLLTNSPKSARDILKALKGTGTLSEESKKKAVNSALYKLLKDGKAVKSETTPPFWTKPIVKNSDSDNDSSSDESITGIFIDVSNSPCHEEALKYVSQNTPVWLFASPTTPIKIPELKSYATDMLVSEGETIGSQMIVTATSFACAMTTIGRTAKIVLVSKSGMLHGVDRMIKASNPKVEVDLVTDGWDGLKLILE